MHEVLHDPFILKFKNAYVEFYLCDLVVWQNLAPELMMKCPERKLTSTACVYLKT